MSQWSAAPSLVEGLLFGDIVPLVLAAVSFSNLKFVARIHNMERRIRFWRRRGGERMRCTGELGVTWHARLWFVPCRLAGNIVPHVEFGADVFGFVVVVEVVNAGVCGLLVDRVELMRMELSLVICDGCEWSGQ